MAENKGEGNFWWTSIKAGAAMTLLDHMFPTEEKKATEYDKLSLEKKQKINDLEETISKYNEKISDLKLKLGEAIFKEEKEYENDFLNVTIKELKELTEEISSKENQLKSIKIFNKFKKEEQKNEF